MFALLLCLFPLYDVCSLFQRFLFDVQKEFGFGILNFIIVVHFAENPFLVEPKVARILDDSNAVFVVGLWHIEHEARFERFDVTR
jgi:hypothetical protein